jgi:excisionase family DNA binding protein
MRGAWFSLRMRTNIAEPQVIDRAADGMLDKGEVAARLRIGKRTVNLWMKRGWLPYIKLGTVVRFRWGDVLAKLNERRVH